MFELLQNADDNKFTRARHLGVAPFFSFHVYPNRIVIECNEDGFTREDLTAICAVGQSTKSTGYGYIGAKGIGFKSVFIAAWKVYIQSRNFSFYFNHEKGDPGLGMVLPVWQDSDDELPDPLTRMTLYLHEQGDPAEITHLRKTVFKQLEDLQETCLLFLRNLEEIRIDFYDESGATTRSKSFKVNESGERNKHLDVTTWVPGGVTTSSLIYHVTRHSATGLAGSDNRESQETEEGRAASSTAEVILAFPLTENFEPVVESQHMFAFLPVRQGDFKVKSPLTATRKAVLIREPQFIIQADFDTSANRQDILTTSRRNVGLLDGIADAFVKAVLQFCDDDTLCYTWPYYLRSADEIGGFWAGLVDSIKSRLLDTPILRSRHRIALRRTTDVCFVSNHSTDRNGNCLFDDRALDPFIAKGYTALATQILKGYGLGVLSFDTVFDLLKADLESQDSRVRSRSTSEDWHTRMAKLFSYSFEAKFTSVIAQLRTFDILPLRDGRWVSANSGVLYLPTTGKFPIPPGVDMRVLDPLAVANSRRRSLFLHLGAKESSKAQVRNAILGGYGQRTQPQDLATSKAHLHYLYLTHVPGQAPERGWENVHVCGDDGSPTYPRETDMYLTSSHRYGPEALLSPSEGLLGLRVPLLHSSYLDGEPSYPDSSHPGWKEWLCHYVGLHDRLRLSSRSGDSLSDTFKYVADYRPEKLLGLLQYLWEYEGQNIRRTSGIAGELGLLPAGQLCTERGHPSECKLIDCYLPLPCLQRQCARYMEEGENFPFLKLPGATSTKQIEDKWGFLHSVLQVRMATDERFFQDILRRIQYCNPEGLSLNRIRRLVDLYLAIEAKIVGDLEKAVV